MSGRTCHTRLMAGKPGSVAPLIRGPNHSLRGPLVAPRQADAPSHRECRNSEIPEQAIRNELSCGNLVQHYPVGEIWPNSQIARSYDSRNRLNRFCALPLKITSTLSRCSSLKLDIRGTPNLQISPGGLPLQIGNQLASARANSRSPFASKMISQM